ncbi:MAG: immunoglobulin domain-containing protein, partial [Limisphaerales bacterium]
PMLANSFVAIGSSDGRTTCGTCFGVRRFKGMIDEVDYFNRALSAAEIAAIYAAGVSGKCLTPSAPYIYTQPANQVVAVGGGVTFSVGVAGTPPLSYQWSFDGSALDGATNASLTLTNVQFSQAGNYSVVITNVAGTASSSNATLSVNFPPALVDVVNVTNAQSGATVNVPVSLAANGNENGLSFSLDFDTNNLTYVSTALGSGASGATLLTNATQAANGKLGVILALPPAQAFAAGTQEMVEVTFMTAVRTNDFSTTVSFGDVPIGRELSDASGNLLGATYASGVVWIQAAAFEGDVSPRPNGDKALTLRDWVQEGRFVAGLDYPTNASEFQRADCAPRATLGDGEITVIDWVQVGRYAAQLDPLTVAGGPTTNDVNPGGPISKSGATPVTPHDVTCALEVANTMVIQGLTGTASVLLESMGDENALGFSLVFDPSALNYVSAGFGSASNGVTLFVNDSQAGAGRLGFVLGLGAGQTFVAGTRELARVSFRAAAAAQGNCPVSFADQPVVCEVSDTNAQRLAAGYVNGTITVNPLPSLNIGRSGDYITLAWPLWATNFGLQAAPGGLGPTLPWTNLVAVPTLTSNQAVVTLPLVATNVFYRLYQQ